MFIRGINLAGATFTTRFAMPAAPLPPTDTITAGDAAPRINAAAMLAEAAQAYFTEHPELDFTTYTWSAQIVRDLATGATVHQMHGVCQGRRDLRWAIAVAPGLEIAELIEPIVQ
jgi:hypothetical protein